MATLFNQTNLNSGTSFAAGAGGGLNPTVQTITAASNVNNYINMSDVSGNLRVATGASTLTVSFNTETDTRIQLLPVGGLKIGFFNSAGSPAPGAYWAVGNNLGNSNWGIDLNSVSSLRANVAPQGINMNALVSTLASAYPGCVS